MNVYPFRRTLLRLLRPHDIARLTAALNCELTKKERLRFMNILDDIFPDRTEVDAIQNFHLRIQLFGADILSLEQRLLRPEKRHGASRPLNIFALVSAPVGNPWGDAERPRWTRLNSSYDDINVYTYNYAKVGDTTPWVPINGRLISRTFGFPYNVDQAQLRMPCWTIENGNQKYLLQHGYVFSRRMFEDAINKASFLPQDCFVTAMLETGTHVVFSFPRSLPQNHRERLKLPTRRWSHWNMMERRFDYFTIAPVRSNMGFDLGHLGG